MMFLSAARFAAAGLLRCVVAYYVLLVWLTPLLLEHSVSPSLFLELSRYSDTHGLVD